jgi:hypothetical protein
MSYQVVAGGNSSEYESKILKDLFISTIIHHGRCCRPACYGCYPVETQDIYDCCDSSRMGIITCSTALSTAI